MPVLMKTALHLGRTVVPLDPELRKLVEEKFVWWMLDRCIARFDEFGTGEAIYEVQFVGVCPEFELIRHGKRLPSYLAVYTTLENGEKRVSFIKK